jgi:hypothetical protein
MTKKPKDKLRILSMDGGTHGFTWLFCLREIEENNPGFLTQADVFAGSSFGGFCSLYFGRHIGALKDGESALGLIDGCLEFMKELLDFDPDEAAFARLVNGVESMYSHERMEKILTDPKHLGNATLADMHRRVIISTFGTKQPSWSPKVYDSAHEEDLGAIASEIGMESAALPLLLPIRNGLANGSLGGTNGSLHALTHVVGGRSKVSLDNVVLLSLGGDPKTSNLADFPTPWDGDGSVPKKFSLDGLIHPQPESAKAFEMLNAKVDSLWKELEANMQRYGDTQYTKPRYGFEMTPPKKEPTLPTSHRSTSWGWRQWLTYESAPLFLYQVITNNQALDASAQVGLLLGERSFRLAPMALLNYGQILFMTFLSEVEASGLIVKVAELTAELWADPETSRKFEFTPNVEETEAFVDTHWMPHAGEHRVRRKDVAGWRRGRSEWTYNRK